MTKQILFIGENRSPLAISKGWRWEDGRLAAKTLFEALRALGVDPLEHDFVNLWPDLPRAQVVTEYRERMLRADARAGKLIVALGAKVSAGLVALEIEHVALIHPAARGKIRGRGRYATHVAERLGPEVRACAI